ncbi:GumC family protein [Geminocystis sp.]|uniref:GumC family protein n=1 Tax=Geminocystis sp. TaxID=2664100 RepID=UPI003592FF5C
MVTETQQFALEEIDELPSSPINKGNQLKFYFNILRRKWLIILAFSLLGFIPAFAITSRDPLLYTGTFEMTVEPFTTAQKVTDATTLARNGQTDSTLLSLDYPTITRILRSRDILGDVAARINKKNPQISQDFLLVDFKENFSLNQAKESGDKLDKTKIINVTYKGYDPDFVILVLNEVADKYLEYSSQEREKTLESGVKFIKDQLPKIKERIKEAQNKQQQIQLENQLVNPQIKGDSLFEITTATDKELQSIQSQLKELNILSSNLQKDLGLSPKDALIASTLSQEPQRQQLLVQLQQVDSQIALDSARLTPDHPTLLNLKEQRDNINNLVTKKTSKILNENNIDPNISPRVLTYQDNNRLSLIGKLIDTQNQIDALSSRYESLSQSQTDNKAELDVIPDVIKKYNELERQITLDTELLNKLSVQKETLSVEISQTQLPWQIVSTPKILTDSFGNVGFKPDPTKKLGAGIMAGFFLGIFVAIVIEKRRDIFYGESDLEYSFGLPILGKVLLDPEGKKKSKLDDVNFFNESSIIDKAIPPSQVSLSEIYTNLHFQLPQSPKNYIIISSLNPDDGQAYITANLAKTAAKIDQKVLLIDANVVNSEIQQYFDLPIRKGLRDLLQFPISQDSVISQIGCEKNVSILTAGSDDADLPLNLGAEETQSLIQSVSQDYTLILYNSSFFLESYDISLLAEKTQGIILVVRLEQTPYSLIKQAVERIQNYNLNFLGFIVSE